MFFQPKEDVDEYDENRVTDYQTDGQTDFQIDTHRDEEGEEDVQQDHSIHNNYFLNYCNFSLSVFIKWQKIALNVKICKFCCLLFGQSFQIF